MHEASSRRQLLAFIAALGTLAAIAPARAGAAFTPTPVQVARAKRERRMLFYTTNSAKAVQAAYDVFNERFPGAGIDVVQADASELITRVKAEAASNKLVADVVDHSDRAAMLAIEALFADYEPPNATSYFDTSLVSPKLWPRLTPGWLIAYNTELTKVVPKGWMDLTKPEYADGQIGEVIGPSSAATWTRIMFEKLMLGEGYWAKQAATKPVLYPTNGPAADALAIGDVSVAPLLSSAILPRIRRGAPVVAFFPPEGVPIVPNAAGIPKNASNPATARLFLDWCLSEDGQAFFMKDQGYLTSLKKPPYSPDGLDLTTAKAWTPKFDQFQTLHDKWINDWNTVYGYR